MFKQYYLLAKPGIVYGNAIVAAGGFFLASRGHIDLMLFAAMLVGISLIMASACVLNNYIDRGIDAKMSRTRVRALVQKTIPVPFALVYALVLGVMGAVLLGQYTNLLTLNIAFVGGIFYLVLYGIFKRKSVHNTLVGSIAGAVPPVVGYCAVTNNFDAGAAILFLLLVIWQMPHFYAISIFRHDDYKAAGIPMMAVAKGTYATKIQMMFYIMAYILAVPALTVYGLTGYAYLAVMLLVSIMWFVLGVRGFRTENDALWARKMFRFSLLVLMVFSIMISVSALTG